MFISAAVSLVVYTLVFFRLRGNLIAEGYRIKVLSVDSSRAWNLEAGRAVMESNTMSVAWQLMWYPVAYTLTVRCYYMHFVIPVTNMRRRQILPITVSRWVEFSGATVPFEARIFSVSRSV